MEFHLDISTFFYTALAFLIPLCSYKVNQWLHQKGDPAWKKADRQQNSQQKQGKKQRSP